MQRNYLSVVSRIVMINQQLMYIRLDSVRFYLDEIKIPIHAFLYIMNISICDSTFAPLFITMKIDFLLHKI